MTFAEWLARQVHRDDPVGDLARDAAADSHFPRDVVTCPAVLAYLTRRGACDGALSAVTQAFRDMRTASSRNPLHRRTAPAGLRARVLERDGFKCRRCGDSPRYGARLVIDHVRPFAAGGTTTIENLQTLCVRCNAGKSHRAPTAHDLAVGAVPGMVAPPDCAPDHVCRPCADALLEHEARSHRLIGGDCYEAHYQCEHGHTWATYYASSCMDVAPVHPLPPQGP